MAPTLIILALLALGVAIVAWVTRGRSSNPASLAGEQDTVWNDPTTPAGSQPTDENPFTDAPPASTTGLTDEDRRP